ncbi:MAG: type II/IV secretion system protein [wastewater metagenome]|nr:type II/IV secretion system protein [Candidatus Loosdrechtia aerotolerans]
MTENSPFRISKELFYDLEKGFRENTAQKDLQVFAAQPEIIRGLNFILIEAIRLKSSDIHLEACQDHYVIRFRIDGLLHEVPPIPFQFGIGLISRIKVLSRLSISERALPQDGRFTINIDQRVIELRVSIIPMIFGEGVVIRILDKSAVKLQIPSLGVDDRGLKILRENIQKSSGIILVTGPTGSGKTTTLYAILNELNQADKKIVTTEDPVEYEINSIMQVEIKPEIDLTFAVSLRSILRQDPDIILVGEIRDTETAKIAIEASLTGHLVLSTVHTRNTVGTLSRLVDMGVEPYLLADTVNLIVAQRLVRVICKHCREPYAPGEEELLSLNAAFLNQPVFYRGKGCHHCNFTRYRGRTGLFEIMNLTGEERNLISAMEINEPLYETVRKNGLVSLREYGIQKIVEGITTYHEVMENTYVIL